MFFFPALFFFVALLCFFLMFKVLRYGAFGPGWRGHGGHRGGRRRMPLRWLLRRLDLGPSQERVVREAVGRVREAAASQRVAMRDERAALAEALRPESIDEAQLSAVLGAPDRAFEALRPVVQSALREIHDVLDSEQRERLARLIERGPHRAW